MLKTELVEAIDSLVSLTNAWLFRGTDIQEKDKKKAKNKQNRARSGKDQVKSKSKVIHMKKIQLEGLKLPNLKLYYKRKRQGSKLQTKAKIAFKLYNLRGPKLPTPKKSLLSRPKTQLQLTGRALIDVYEGELTLRVGKEAVTFNLDQTLRYSSNYDDMTANRIDVIEMACEEYSQEVLGFSDVIASGNPTPYYDPIVSTSSPTLTPFGDSDFLLEEVDAFLALEDDPTSPEVDDSYYDPEGDILLLEAFLNDDPSITAHPTHGKYFADNSKELKVYEAKTDKSSIDEPPEVELKDLPPHLEYTFLEGDNKLPVIIAKDLSVEEKAALIKVLKSHKRAIA
ncbi:hypothetical protein Tco_0642354 [Tanacetum coccineum]